MPREPIPTWYFAAVVVKHGDRFLLVQERKKDQGWHLPAGRVEPEESIAEGAVRETLEESGVKIRLTGILRIEHTPGSEARLRVVFLGEPRGATTTKQKPDRESLRAEWVSLAELPKYKLRRRGIEEVIRYVMNGGAAYPLDVLQEEGRPYPRARSGDGRGEEGTMGRLRRSIRVVLTGRDTKG